MTAVRPTIFADADDVICVNKTYGFYDVLAVGPKPADLFEKLFDPTAAGTLRRLVSEHSPRIVLTTSWLRFLDRAGFEQLFDATGLEVVAAALHDHWDAPQNRGQTRFDAIDTWLKAHHGGEPIVILDDRLSGTGLADSRLRSYVAWCDLGVGLGAGHIEAVRSILAKRPPRSRPALAVT